MLLAIPLRDGRKPLPVHTVNNVAKNKDGATSLGGPPLHPGWFVAHRYRSQGHGLSLQISVCKYRLSIRLNAVRLCPPHAAVCDCVLGRAALITPEYWYWVVLVSGYHMLRVLYVTITLY